jgi:hypothetical protein
VRAAESFILASYSDPRPVTFHANQMPRDCRLMCTCRLMQGCACIDIMPVRHACEVVPCASRTRHEEKRSASFDVVLRGVAGWIGGDTCHVVCVSEVCAISRSDVELSVTDSVACLQLCHAPCFQGLVLCLCACIIGVGVCSGGWSWWLSDRVGPCCSPSSLRSARPYLRSGRELAETPRQQQYFSRFGDDETSLTSFAKGCQLY